MFKPLTFKEWWRTVGTRTVRFSDVSGKEIDGDDDLAYLIIRQHPLLDGERAVRIDAKVAEVQQLADAEQNIVSVELHLPGEYGGRMLAMELDAFDSLLKLSDDTLAGAERVYDSGVSVPAQGRRRGRPRGSGTSTTAREKIDYSDPAYAGRVKRGIISDAEKQTIREHFDEVNKNLAAAGQRVLDLNNKEHVKKYGLQELAKQRAS